jgi:FkbM family methyltransferase
MKSLAFKALRGLGLDVRQARKHPSLADFLKIRRVSVVYDVGANVGQFGLALRRRRYQGRIVSVEPVKDAFDRLKQIAAADGNWEATRCAVGAVEGQITINVSRNSQFSSVKPPAATAPSIDPNSEIVGAECVDSRRLDSLIRDSGPSLIRIDTQGFEREVLAGASVALSRVVGVLMELPIINIYEDHWYLPEALDYMRNLGFLLCQMEPVGHHHLDPMATIEFDCLFRRATEGIDWREPQTPRMQASMQAKNFANL